MEIPSVNFIHLFRPREASNIDSVQCHLVFQPFSLILPSSAAFDFSRPRSHEKRHIDVSLESAIGDAFARNMSSSADICFFYVYELQNFQRFSKIVGSSNA
jgi:hypothetical protein